MMTTYLFFAILNKGHTGRAVLQEACDGRHHDAKIGHVGVGVTIVIGTVSQLGGWNRSAEASPQTV